MRYLLIICALLMFTQQAYSQVFSFETESEVGTAVLPRGTMIKTVLQESVSSNTNAVGDEVVFVNQSDLMVGKAICIPKDSVFIGKVAQLEHAQRGRDGYFQIVVNEVIFPDGWRTQLSATIWTRDGTGVVGGAPAVKNEYKKIPHNIHYVGSVVQLVKTGEEAMGQDRTLIGGKDVILVLEDNLQVNYLENFR